MVLVFKILLEHPNFMISVLVWIYPGRVVLVCDTKFGSRVPHFDMLLNNGAAHQLQNKNDENKFFVSKNQVISYFCKPKE